MRELDDLGRLLASSEKLKERAQAKPFFEKRPQLAALMGIYAKCGPANLLSYEFAIEGDFRADIVVGNSELRTYCMVELEEGDTNSIFATSNRSMREWSPKFDHGFSQLIDCFCALEGMRRSPRFTDLFGLRPVKFHGLLVIGREPLAPGESRRLQWRSDHVKVDSNDIRCITYDELHKELSVLFSNLTQTRPVD